MIMWLVVAWIIGSVAIIALSVRITPEGKHAIDYVDGVFIVALLWPIMIPWFLWRLVRRS